MRVAIVGAGSIGAVLGGKLAASGHEVALVARGAHLDALRERGLTLVDHVGAASGTYRLPASDEPADFGEQDLVVIGLKAHAIPAMLPRMKPLIGDETVVVPAINGLPWWYFQGVGGSLDGLTLRSLDPDGTMPAALDASHILGELDNASSDRLHAVCDALDIAGFETVRSTDIRLDVWTKLIGNLSFNPIAALTGYLMNQIVGDEQVLDVIRAMMVEGMQVAERVGIHVGMTPDQRIDLARQLGAAKISMLQDLEQRRRMELGAIVASVIELAGHVGVDVPTVRHVHALAHARARVLGID
jgi:2-dehydropantoate 2-reductase